MKPFLFDAQGRPTHFKMADKVYKTVEPEKFAPWDGSPVKHLTGDDHEMSHGGIFMRKEVQEHLGLVEPAPLPEVVAVEETMDPQTLRRARALKRLGGGPLFKAEQEAKRKKQVETQMGIKALFDGLRRRPVL